MSEPDTHSADVSGGGKADKHRKNGMGKNRVCYHCNALYSLLNRLKNCLYDRQKKEADDLHDRRSSVLAGAPADDSFVLRRAIQWAGCVGDRDYLSECGGVSAGTESGKGRAKNAQSIKNREAKQVEPCKIQ